MRTQRLGKTELIVTKTAFGALPIQRLTKPEAAKLLRAAYDAGINYFDTANAYSDSEEKIGLGLSDVRDKIVISTKTGASDAATARVHVENSLRMMKTDYIDIVQLHNPAVLPDPNDDGSSYAALVKLKEQGYIGHIGITNHRAAVAREAIRSGLYETLQYPYCYLAAEIDDTVMKECLEADMGFIAMKGMSGGLITDAAAAHLFMSQRPGVVPIWGIQRQSELDQWIALENGAPIDAEAAQRVIEHDRKELAGNFCRGCGYCLPCPAGIDIPVAARMSLWIRRAPYKQFMSSEFKKTMHRIDDCIECRACASRCPYGLDTPKLLKLMLADYDEFYEVHGEK